MSDRERQEIVDSLREAVTFLERSMNGALVPDSGSNIAYAASKARDLRDVATIKGRISRKGDHMAKTGLPSFGECDEVARIVLTAMKFDPEIRSATVIMYSQKTVEVLKDLLYEVCSFDRTREPPGISTMDWGVASCCREGVPDAIFDRGAPGKEGLIRIFAENPVELVNIIAKISRRG
jgi:predicted fused transcriptional regulator/phosphomethylpyrimidine kinase